MKFHGSRVAVQIRLITSFVVGREADFRTQFQIFPMIERFDSRKAAVVKPLKADTISVAHDKSASFQRPIPRTVDNERFGMIEIHDQGFVNYVGTDDTMEVVIRFPEPVTPERQRSCPEFIQAPMDRIQKVYAIHVGSLAWRRVSATGWDRHARQCFALLRRRIPPMAAAVGE